MTCAVKSAAFGVPALFASLLCCAILLAGRAQAEAGGATAEGAAAPQIMVMIKEAPLRHLQPGASYTPDYRRQAVSARAMRIAEELGRDYHLRIVSNWPMPALGVRCFVVELLDGASAETVVARLAEDTRVESTQIVQSFHVLGQGEIYSPYRSSAKEVRYVQLHKMATGRNVVIAEIDTGIDISHPSLRGQMTLPVNLVDASDYRAEAHGTAVAGVIVARDDAGSGATGLAPAATLLPLRACWEAGAAREAAVCNSFTLAKALQYALGRKPQLINMSLAGPYDRLVERLVVKAVEQGIVVVAAVDPLEADGGFPARVTGVIAVSATQTARPAVIAPGDHILTTFPGSSWGLASGNSMATAHVSGVAALLLELEPGLSPARIAELMRNVSDTGHQSEQLDACAVVARIAHRGGCACCDAVATPSRPSGRQRDQVS